MRTLRKSRVLAGVAGVVTAGCLVAAGAVAWAAAGDDDPAPRHSTAAEMQAEYRAAEAAYDMPFPEGVKLPDPQSWTDQLTALAGEDTSFEEGFGESQLMVTWMCAWERKYFDALTGGDETGTREARTQLDGFRDSALAQKYWSSPDYGWEREVLYPVDTGDLSGLENDLRNSCDPVFQP